MTQIENIHVSNAQKFGLIWIFAINWPEVSLATPDGIVFVSGINGKAKLQGPEIDIERSTPGGTDSLAVMLCAGGGCLVGLLPGWIEEK